MNNINNNNNGDEIIMGKIKGWNLVHKTTKLIRYRSDDYQTHIEINKTSFNHNKIGWFVDVILPSKILSAEYSTKQKALDRATKYMKTHPKG